MAKGGIATPELSDAGTLSAGPSAAEKPAANLQTMQPGESWRATDLGAVWFDLNMPAAPSVNLVALVAHTATAAATWRIRAAATQVNLTAAPDYDSNPVSMWPPAGRPADYDRLASYLWLGAAVEAWPWWRVDIFDAGNPAGFIDVGRLYVANLFQPSRNFSFGRPLGWSDPSPRERSAGGQTYVLERESFRSESLNFRFLDAADFAAAAEIDRKRGRKRDVLVLPDADRPEDMHREMIHGLLTELRPFVHRGTGLFERTYTIEELLP